MTREEFDRTLEEVEVWHAVTSAQADALFQRISGKINLNQWQRICRRAARLERKPNLYAWTLLIESEDPLVTPKYCREEKGWTPEETLEGMTRRNEITKIGPIVAEIVKRYKPSGWIPSYKCPFCKDTKRRYCIVLKEGVRVESSARCTCIPGHAEIPSEFVRWMDEDDLWCRSCGQIHSIHAPCKGELAPAETSAASPPF